MPVNVQYITIKNLIEEINRRDFYSNLNFHILDTNTILNKIVAILNDVAQYIKNCDEEIERLASENSSLKSDLIKIQLELLEYKNKESNNKKK